jgi:hypothetical protein
MALMHATTHGALARGDHESVMDGFGPALAEPVAYQAYAEVHLNLDRSLRNPTPIYETTIQVDRSVPDFRVHDGDRMVYGPWLEGTGSRNATTRFKGYWSFRRAVQQVEARVPELVQPVVDVYLGRLS